MPEPPQSVMGQALLEGSMDEVDHILATVEVGHLTCPNHGKVLWYRKKYYAGPIPVDTCPECGKVMKLEPKPSLGNA